MFGLFNKATDPVCNMKINKKEAKFSMEHDGEKMYFCSENCKNKFSTSPEKYVQSSGDSCCH